MYHHLNNLVHNKFQLRINISEIDFNNNNNNKKNRKIKIIFLEISLLTFSKIRLNPKECFFLLKMTNKSLTINLI